MITHRCVERESSYNLIVNSSKVPIVKRRSLAYLERNRYTNRKKFAAQLEAKIRKRISEIACKIISTVTFPIPTNMHDPYVSQPMG